MIIKKVLSSTKREIPLPHGLCTQCYQPLTQQTPRYIATFSGGGVNGIQEAVAAQYFEEETSYPFYQLFDAVSGASTGGILAAALSLGMPAEQALENYRTDSLHIFDSQHQYWFSFNRTLRPKYDRTGLDHILQTRFTATLTLADLKIPTYIPSISYNYPTDNGPTKKFTVFSSEAAKEDPLKNIPIWQALAATTSAETYFAPFTMTYAGHEQAFGDGGVVSNYPQVLGLSYAKKMWGPTSDVSVVAFNCPRQPVETGLHYTYGALQLIPDLVYYLVGGQEEPIDLQMRNLIGDQYFKIQASGPTGDLDDISDQHLQALQDTMQTYISENRDTFESWADKLRRNAHTQHDRQSIRPSSLAPLLTQS